MSHTIDNTVAESLESVLALNDALLEQHKSLRVFRIFSDGTLSDPAKREILMACLQVMARHFQTILFARQAHCADERLGALFRKHLNEEIGHDDILRKDRGRTEEVWDPVIEGTAAWFVSRMMVLDNIEKLAVVHLVLEASGAAMGATSKVPMQQFGSSDYFGLHDEVDSSHVMIALDPLRWQSPQTLKRVRIVLEQAWRMMNAQVERVGQLVLGEAPVTFCAPENR